MRNRIPVLMTALALGASLLVAQKPKSQKEVDAIMAMQNATDADGRIKAAQELIQKFADTEFKPYALYYIASSYQQKGDTEQTMFWAEETLKVDKKSFMSMIMVAQVLANKTREFDLDKEEKLTKAAKMANAALEEIKVAVKPNPAIPDDQWEAAKKDYSSQAYEALGMAASVRKSWPEAIKNLQLAYDNAATPDPATGVRLASALNGGNKPDEAIAVADKVLASANVHPVVANAAKSEKERATKLKTAK